MATLTLSRLTKSYGALEVIPPLDLDVADGEFVALVGPSGCGKSTLLRLVAGLEDANGGTVRLDGRDVTSAGPPSRGVAMVFQNYALYPHMTVEQNMNFGLRIAGCSRVERTEKVLAAAGMLGIGDLLHRRPSELSGGQRQRVAMGRAIVREPQIFLFDEPLSNLDAELRVRMRAEIKALHARLGVTTLYVTHDQIEAMTLADRIVVLRAGRIEQVGKPMDLFERPETRFVAGFIGSPAINFLEGTAKQGVLDFGGGVRLRLPEGLPDGPLTVGVRPQYWRETDAKESLPVTVETVEPTGTETHLNMRFGQTRLTAILEGYRPLAYGDRLRVVPKENAIIVFGPDDERLLP
ncbi:MAG: sn-glycerol-3-phosphate ABC transporter ATP-binding protein UgpC [Pseudomonadota bacterium]